MQAVGLLLAAVLMALGVATGYRQLRTRRRLREERFLPSDERSYLRGQVVRRFALAAVLVALGGMLAGYYLSGMDAGMDEIAERKKQKLAPADQPGRQADENPQDEADRAFTKFVGFYVIGILLLVFVIACVAIIDFWATRRFWMAQYRLLREDHQAKLQRDLAVYRQSKDNERLGGRGGNRPGDGSGDDTDEQRPLD